jgi:Uma2 family endonuclease
MVAQIQKTADQPNEFLAKPLTTDLGAAPRRYSAEDYLAMEVQSEIRHEFRAGEIIPMTSGMPNHNRIVRNLCTLLTVALKGRLCEVFVTDQRLWIPHTQIYTYPDVMVIQGELQLQEGRRDTVTNPFLIVEVLSKSTQDYDRGGKFAAYRTIPSFQEYVLVDQHCQNIEHYVQAGPKKWSFQEYDEMDAVVKLATINLEIAIADIYNRHLQK